VSRSTLDWAVGQEIERKFLVRGEPWKQGAPGVRMRQGYLSLDKERTVRVRVAGEQAWLTIKGEPRGLTRAEFEYEIPLADARRLLDELCHQPILDKTRYRIRHGAHMWEIDVFHGPHEGLVLAEIELASENEAFARPHWIAEEVSGDPRYANANLVLGSETGFR
jgi:adenylate cyclase